MVAPTETVIFGIEAQDSGDAKVVMQISRVVLHGLIMLVFVMVFHDAADHAVLRIREAP